MPYTTILTGDTHSIGGIKDFNLAARDTDGNVISFPLNITMESGTTNTILTYNYFDKRQLRITSNYLLEYRHIMPNFAEYNEEEIEDRRGIYFKKTLNFSIPKVNLTTQNQIKEFLFNAGGEFSTNGVVLFFTDSNNQKWLANYSVPFILEEFEEDTGARDGNNNYNFTYICNDYYRSTKYKDRVPLYRFP